MQSIRRLYVAKKDFFADEAKRMLADLQENLLIKGLTDIKIYHRYDVGGLDDAAFDAAKYWLLNICLASMTRVLILQCSACRC